MTASSSSERTKSIYAAVVVLVQVVVLSSLLVIGVVCAIRIWVPDAFSWALTSSDDRSGLFRAGDVGRTQNLIFFGVAVTTGYLLSRRLWNVYSRRTQRSSDDEIGPIPRSGATRPVVRNQRYGTNRIKSRIGSGGSSEVYLGETATGQKVAIKVLRSNPTDAKRARDQLRRESEVLKRIQLGGVAQIVSEGLEDPEPWIAFQYIEGLSLRDHVNRYGPMRPDVVQPLAFRLFGLLSELHQQGAAHRDISPNNIILSRQGPVLVDFGTARIDLDHAVTGSQLLVGTPGYYAPEVLDGSPVGTPADVFNLARVLQFCLTGTDPETASLDVFGDWDNELSRAMAKATELDPRNRAQAPELVELLRCNTLPLESLEFRGRDLVNLPRQISLADQALTAAAAALIVSAAVVSLVPTNEIRAATPPPEVVTQRVIERVITPSPSITDRTEGVSDIATTADSLVATADALGSLEVTTHPLTGGWFRSLPQPRGWLHVQKLPREAFHGYAEDIDSDDVVEAHTFVKHTEGLDSILALVLSVEAVPHAETGNFQDPKDSLLYRKFVDGVAQFETYAAEGCPMEASDDYVIDRGLVFFVAVDLDPACSERHRLYVAASFIEPQHSTNFRLEIFFRGEEPISISALVDATDFREDGVRAGSAATEFRSFLELAGWDDQTAQAYAASANEPVFTAVISVPEDGEIVLASPADDANIYEARLQFSYEEEQGGYTIPAGQWLTYNAPLWPDFINQVPSRNQVAFPGSGMSNATNLIINVEPVQLWDAETTDDFREPFWNRDPLPITQAAAAPAARVKLNKPRPFIGVHIIDFSKPTSGALISKVSEGSPAERAGIKAGEVITELDGNKMHSVEDVLATLEDHQIGDLISVTLLEEDGTQRVLSVELESTHDDAISLVIRTDWIFDYLSNLGVINDEDFDVEVLSKPRNIGLIGLPMILPFVDSDFDFDLFTVGPKGLELGVGWLTPVRSGEIDGDAFFEGTEQFVSTFERPVGLSSQLRLFFGETGPLLLGENPRGRPHWSSLQNCMDIGAWRITDRTKLMTLNLVVHYQCDIGVPGGTSATHAPLFSFELFQRNSETPVLLGDFIPADFADLFYLERLLTKILSYMTPTTYPPDEVIKACSNVSDGVSLLATEITEESLQDILTLFDDAITEAFIAAAIDESWEPLLQLIIRVRDDFVNFEEPDIGLYREVATHCGYLSN